VQRDPAAVGASACWPSADDDVEEARAGRLPQASLSGQVGGVDAGAPNTTPTRGAQVQGGLSVSAPLYDGGRITDLTDWRRHLAEAARFGEIGAQEQVALQTVSLALERSRYSVESQVYEQYAHKMGCLVDALQMIVSVDRGRTSELVQARKTQQQAELSRDQSLSQKRLAEVRLRRFVGDDLPPVDGITSVMLDTPALDDLLTMAARASDVQQLDSQADAMDSYVRAILDGQKPQLGLLVAATKSAGAGISRSVSGGVTVSWQLYNAANTSTTNSARKRALAARLQRDDALEARKNRMAEVHEQADHAMQRARQIVEILHNSELVRNFTLQQWQQLGRRSLFDVMGAEGDHYNMRVQYVDALYDTQQSNALLWSLGLGLAVHLQ
jgi:adhesin transport system outer membrane protein